MTRKDLKDFENLLHKLEVKTKIVKVVKGSKSKMYKEMKKVIKILKEVTTRFK